MRITASYYQPTAYPQTAVKEKNRTSSVSSTFAIAKADSTVSVKQTKDVWKQLKEKYDIRHCTFQDLCDISSSLYTDGEISLLEHAIITFDYNHGIADLRKNNPNIRNDMNWTPADAEGNRDWIAEFKARAMSNLEVGDMRSYIMDSNLAKILSRLRR